MKYFAMIEGRRLGPLSIEELVNEGITPGTYVWRKGLPDWIPARDEAEICRHFRNRLHDLLHPSPPGNPPGTPAVTAHPEPADEEKSYFRLRAEIAARQEEEELHNPPSGCPAWLIILAFICFFPLGIAAALNNRKALGLWNARESQQAHDAARRARMSALLAICLGVMIFATLLRYL